MKNLFLLSVSTLAFAAPALGLAAPVTPKTLDCRINAILADGSSEQSQLSQKLQPASTPSLGLSASITQAAYGGRLRVNAWAHQQSGADFPAWKADFVRITILDTQTGVEVGSLPRAPANGSFLNLDAAEFSYTFHDSYASGVIVECALH